MRKNVVLIGTLDTKGDEFNYLKNLLLSQGFSTTVIDVGVLGDPSFGPDISANQVAQAGGRSLTELRAISDRGGSMECMGHGIAATMTQLYEKGKVQGVISLGGGQGTYLATSGMRVLPIGIPKVMVSTIAAVNPQPFVDISDITMIPSVVDFAGLNSIARVIIKNAVAAVAGMANAENRLDRTGELPRAALTMFGVTTPCVDHSRKILESNYIEACVFAATGVGDRSMEDLIEQGYFQGVLDITTSNVGQEWLGGINQVGPERLEVAGRRGIPQVISLGGLDFVNYRSSSALLEKLISEGRVYYQPNPTLTLMRTSEHENVQTGQIIAKKINSSRGPVALLIPLKGISSLDEPQGVFFDPKADHALFESIKQNLATHVEVIEMDCHINEKTFSVALSEKFLELIGTL